MKILFFAGSLILLLLVTGCSDSGESPTEPTPSAILLLSVNDITIIEGITGLFRISLNQKADTIVIIDYFTKDFTAVGAADYTNIDTTRDTIPVGDSLLLVFVPTLTSDGAENAEQFELNVAVISGAEISDSVGIGTILDADSPRFSIFVQPLLINRCALIQCHSPMNPQDAQGGLYIGQVDYQTVINATGLSAGGKVIIPFSATQSLLYERILDATDDNIQMPKTGGFLADTTVAMVGEWIDLGAQEN